MIKKITIALVLFIVYSSFSLSAQELKDDVLERNTSLSKIDRDTFTLHFRVNSSLVEKEYIDNVNTLKAINTIFMESGYLSKFDTITITTATSPDGGLKENEKLSHLRSVAILSYLKWRYPELKDKIFNINSKVSYWSELIPDIEGDNSMPYKNLVLEILENRDNCSQATIEWRLRNIDNGKAWRNIVKHHLYHLRSGETVIGLHTHLATVAVDTQKNEMAVINERVQEQCEVTIQQNIVDTLVTPKKLVHSSDSDFKERQEGCIKPLFALKTNLLFNAISLLNLELEVPLGKHISVVGEVIFPWWTFDNGKADSKRHRIHLFNANIEGRYWFGNREERPKITGWFAGIYAGGGLYDFEHSAKGYQGEFYIMGGLSGGYSHTINKKGNLRMEYSLGVGYMQTDYRRYEANFGSDNKWHPVRQESGRHSWIGPTKAKISLVWMLNRKVK